MILPAAPGSFARIRLKGRTFLDHTQRLGDGAVELGVNFINIILWRDINLDVGVGTIIFKLPAHVFEPVGEFRLRGARPIHKAVARGNADDTAPGTLSNQWSQTHHLENMAEHIAVRTRVFV